LRIRRILFITDSNFDISFLIFLSLHLLSPFNLFLGCCLNYLLELYLASSHLQPSHYILFGHEPHHDEAEHAGSYHADNQEVLAHQPPEAGEGRGFEGVRQEVIGDTELVHCHYNHEQEAQIVDPGEAAEGQPRFATKTR
jgi:hypothetical protein